MERRIRDVFNEEYVISETPPSAPGLGHGAFADEQSAMQFLQRFVGSPAAMSALREVLLGEALPAHRLDPAALIQRMAGRLVTRGLRLISPGGGSGGGAPSIKEGSASAPEVSESEKPAEEEEEEKKKKKTLTARWSPLEAYCADEVKLLGSATNMDAGTSASGVGSTVKAGSVASLDGTGQNSFTLEWRVKDVVFSSPEMPPQKDVQGKLSAGGLTASAPQPLAVKRVPDKELQPVSFGLTSGQYGWTAAFRVGIEKRKLMIRQKLKVTPAWLGKWISFDSEADGREGWGFVKKDAAAWVFWDTSASPPAWTALPRGISEYTVNNLVFIQKGTSFAARGQLSMEWSEAFAQPAGYEQKKAAWLANIHQVWDDKFYLHHKECKSSSDSCCSWRVRVKVEWNASAVASDKEIFAISAQEWERSNAKDWYLTEERIGVAAHECGHLLGAYDEYTGGAVDLTTNKIEDASIMGADLSVAHARHLDGLRDQAKNIINAAIGRSWTFEVK